MSAEDKCDKMAREIVEHVRTCHRDGTLEAWLARGDAHAGIRGMFVMYGLDCLATVKRLTERYEAIIRRIEAFAADERERMPAVMDFVIGARRKS